MRGVTYTGYGRAESRRGDDESAQRLAGVGNCHCPGDGGSRAGDGVSRARNPGLPGASWSLVGAGSWTMAERQLLLAISLGEKESSFSLFIPPSVSPDCASPGQNPAGNPLARESGTCSPQTPAPRNTGRKVFEARGLGLAP